MTTWQLIRTMANRGYRLQAGPHDPGMRGYFACFYQLDVDRPLLAWSAGGHAMTLHRAVLMAAKIVLGQTTVVLPPPSEFEIR